MRITHSDAISLESVVRRVFACDRAGMGGYIDADHFESAPFDAALIALAPLWQKADIHEIEEFLFKWEHILPNAEEMDADIRSYIKELGSLVDLLMQR